MPSLPRPGRNTHSGPYILTHAAAARSFPVAAARAIVLALLEPILAVEDAERLTAPDVGVVGTNAARRSHGLSGRRVLCGTSSRGPAHRRSCSASMAAYSSGDSSARGEIRLDGGGNLGRRRRLRLSGGVSGDPHS